MDKKRKQEIFLDGIEESLKFIKVGYARIISSITIDGSDEKMVGPNMDTLILDCWTIIDIAKRIRTLLENVPGLKTTPELQIFLNRTKNVPTFRHYIQHLETEAPDIAETGKPIWGSVSWAKLTGENKVTVGMYAPGRLASCKGLPVVNPAGREFHGHIDHVELSVEGHTINISELVREILNFGSKFSAAVKDAEESEIRDDNGLIRFQLPTS